MIFTKNWRSGEVRYDDGNEDAKQEMQDSYVRLDWDVEQGPPPQFTVLHSGWYDYSSGDAINGRRYAFVVQGRAWLSSLFPSQCMRHDEELI